MQFPNRAAIIGCVTAIALASCAGSHSIIPSPSSYAPETVLSQGKGPTTCPSHPPQPTWIFKGSCKIGVLPAKGATFILAPYTAKKIVVSAKLPKNTDNGKPFVVVDALGGAAKDILPYKKIKWFPFTSTKLKSFVYVQAVNGFGCVKTSPTCPGLKFTGPYLVFTAKASSFPGKSCFLSFLTRNKKGPYWFTTPFQNPVKNNAVTITATSSGLQQFFPYGLPKGPVFFNLACH